MTPTALLSELQNQGVILKPRGDKLAFGPREKVNHDLREKIIRYKSELLALLQSSPIDATLSGAYRRYWSLPESEPMETFQAVYKEIAHLEAQGDPAVAWATLREAATAFHAETGACPFCRQRGALHLPAEQMTMELSR